LLVQTKELKVAGVRLHPDLSVNSTQQHSKKYERQKELLSAGWRWRWRSFFTLGKQVL